MSRESRAVDSLSEFFAPTFQRAYTCPVLVDEGARPCAWTLVITDELQARALDSIERELHRHVNVHTPLQFLQTIMKLRRAR